MSGVGTSFWLLVVVSLCSLVLRGFQIVEGGDELVEHGLMHGGLASGRVVASIGCFVCIILSDTLLKFAIWGSYLRHASEDTILRWQYLGRGLLVKAL